MLDLSAQPYALLSEHLAERVVRSDALLDLKAYRSELISEIKASRSAFLDGVEAETQGNLNAIKSGIATGHQIALWHDQALQCLARLCFPERSGLCLMAVGGYGFGSMCPGSDLDLLFLGGKPAQNGKLKASIEMFLYLLWDLGFKVGHATRTVEECLKFARDDHSICTALLTRRRLFGSTNLANKLTQEFENKLLLDIKNSFLDQKLAERDARHEQWGGSRYALEPNVKESKGGLRDLDCLIWIARACFGTETFTSLMKKKILTQAERNATRSARDFFLAVRHQLHFMSNGRENRLLFDHQENIAGRLCFQPEQKAPAATNLMRTYFYHARTAGDLTRIICSVLEQSHKHPPLFNGWKTFETRGELLPEPFFFKSGRLTLSQESLKTASSSEIAFHIVNLFRLAQSQRLNIHPDARRLVWSYRRHLRGCLEANSEIGTILLNFISDKNEPDGYLRKIAEAGCLGQILPEWNRVEVHPQFDRYHAYTVGEHTIQVIRALRDLEAGACVKEAPLASRCLASADPQDRQSLYVAAFLHDIGKGYGCSHSQKGAEIATRITPLLGLGEEEKGLVVWLVRNHLILSDAALKRDPDNPETAHHLAELTKSTRRLNLLAILTTADIMGVAPDSWTAWKSTQVTRIYEATLQTLRGRAPYRQEAEIKAGLKSALTAIGWSISDQNRYLETAPASLWGSRTTCDGHLDVQVHFAEIYRQTLWETSHEQSSSLKKNSLKNTHDSRLSISFLKSESMTDMIVCGQDHPGLFARLTGAIASVGIGIRSTRLNTFSDGGVLDIFTVFGPSGALTSAQEKRTRIAILAGAAPTHKQLKRQAPGSIPIHVKFENPEGGTHTVIEVTAQDRVGLIHDLVSTMTRYNLRIHQAHAMVWGERAVQTYYVRDRGGRTLPEGGVTKTLQRDLAQCCSVS